MKEILMFLINHSETIALILMGIALVNCNLKISALEKKIRQIDCQQTLDSIENELRSRN